MADDIQSNIKINIDTTNAMDSIRLLQNQISAFHTQMAKMGAASVADSRNMQQNLINSINSTGAFTANMTKVKTTAEQFTSSLEKNKLTMGEYFRYAGGATKSFGTLFKSEFETINKVARERVKDLQSQYIKLGRDANGAMQAIKVRPLTLDMQNLGTKTQIAAQRQQLLNQLLKQGSTNLLNFGKNTQWAGRQLMVGFTIPLSIMGAAAMRAYKDIEEASIRLKRVYGDLGTTNMETEKMVKEIQNLAQEYTKYGIAVKDSMDMAATAAATGKKGADLLAQVASSARLAVLGGVDQQMALKTTISLTDAFGVSTKQLAKDINFLNAVENQTVLSIEDMTIAIPKAAPVIQQLGGDVKDLAFFLTAMKEGGINASESANALKSGLASLINPTNTASKMLQGFGINLREIVQGNKGDVKKTVVDFAKALDTLDPLNRAKAIEQLFGKFQFARMSTLFKNVIEQGSQASEVLKLANQSSLELSMLAQRELAKIESSPLYKFQKSIADFQAQLAPVGEQFMKALTPIINFGADVLKNFNGLNEGVKGFIVKFVAVAGVVGPVLLMSFGLIANAVANVIKGFALMKDIFNKTGKSSLSLGEQVNYMTQEQIQAAAIASSLDQVHSKLKQTFTSEAAAVDMLTGAYERSVAAQRAFGVPIAPRGPVGKAPVKKYAAGGIISGPGTGTSDSILAMVSNGEAIIPAKSVARNPGMVRQLVSGNIPGYVKGKDSSAQFAHVDENVVGIAAGDLLDRLTQAQENGVKIQKNLMDHLKGVVTDLGRDFRVRGYHGLGFMQDAKLNVGMRGNAPVSTADFIKDFESRGVEKWLKSVKMGGGNIKDVDILEDLKLYDDEIKKGVRQHQQLNNGLQITTEQFSAIEKNARATLKPMSKLKTALDSAETGLFDIRNNLKQSTLSAAGIEMTRKPSRTGVGLSTKSSGRFSTGAYVRESGNRFTKSSAGAIGLINIQEIAEQSAVASMTAVNAGAVSGIKKSTKQRSPSKEAHSAGANIGKGAIQGIQSQIDDAKNAGTQVGQAAAQGVSQSGRVSGRGGRRVRQEEMAPHSVTGQLVPLSMVNSPLYGPEEKPSAQKQASATSGRRGRLSNMLNNAGNRVSSGISGMSQGKFQGGMFGASMIAGLGSMVGGPVGEVSGALSMPLAMAGMFPQIQGALAKIVGGLVRFVPFIGTALAAWQLWDQVAVPLIRKNADSYEALAKTLDVTKEKIDGINSFFGTEGKITGIRAAVTGGLESQGSGKASIAAQFMESDNFKNNFQKSAQGLKDLSDKEVKIAMTALGTDLTGMGYEKEAVQAIVEAMLMEAKKTKVSIDFDSLTFGKKTVDSLSRDMSAIFKTYTENSPFTGFFNAEQIAKTEAAVSEISSLLSGLSGQFQNGIITGTEFSLNYDVIIRQFNALEKSQPGLGVQAMLDVLKQLNPQIAALSGNITSLSSLSNIVQANSLGLNLSNQVYSNLEPTSSTLVQGEQNKKLNAAIRLAQRYGDQQVKNQKQIKNLQSSTADLSKVEQKINDKYDKRITQLDKIKKLNDQLTKSQEGQLSLAEALNKGDIGAAARAAIDIQNTDIQNALDQQKTGLDEAKSLELKGVAAQKDAIADSIDSLQASIETLQTKIESIEIKVVLPESAQAQVVVGGVNGAPPLTVNPKTGTVMPSTMTGMIPDIDDRQPWNQPPYLGVSKSYIQRKASYFARRKLGAATPTTNGIYPIFEKTREDLKTAKTYASGGHITGPGSGTSDSIPAMLSNGEYVIRANAVKTIGVNTLDKLNQADRLGFAAGGIVNAMRDKKPPRTDQDPNVDPFDPKSVAAYKKRVAKLFKPTPRKEDPTWFDWTGGKQSIFDDTGNYPGYYQWTSPIAVGGSFGKVKTGPSAYTWADSPFQKYNPLNPMSTNKKIFEEKAMPEAFPNPAANQNPLDIIEAYKKMLEGRKRLAENVYLPDLNKDTTLMTSSNPVLYTIATYAKAFMNSKNYTNSTGGRDLEKARALIQLAETSKMIPGWDGLDPKEFKNLVDAMHSEFGPQVTKGMIGKLGFGKRYDRLINPPKGPSAKLNYAENYLGISGGIPKDSPIYKYAYNYMTNHYDPSNRNRRGGYGDSPNSFMLNPKLGTYNRLGFAKGGLVGYQDGGDVKSWDLKDPSAPWNQGDFKKFNDYQTRKQYWAMSQPGSRELVEAGKTAGYFAPGIGSGLAFGDAGTAFGKGDVGGGLLNTAFGFGAMWIPKALGMIGKGLGAAGDFIKTGLGIRGGSNALKAAASSKGADVSKVGKLAPRLGFNLSDSALHSMVKDNFYGNMRTGIRSSTSDSLMNRIAVEKNMMGIPANAPASKTPAYGFLTTKEDVPSYYNSIMGGMSPRSKSQQGIDDFNLLVNPMSRYTSRYGSNTIKLKPSTLGKATVSMGDSLSIWDKAIGLGQKIPGVNKLSSVFSTFPALSGKLAATQKMMKQDISGIRSPTNFPYIEAHLPGGFTLKDIESIMLHPTEKFGPQATEKIAAELAERKAALEALFESMGVKGIKITENGGIKIGNETLEQFKNSGGKLHEGSMANYPLPTRGPKSPMKNPFAAMLSNLKKKPAPSKFVQTKNTMREVLDEAMKNPGLLTNRNPNAVMNILRGEQSKSRYDMDSFTRPWQDETDKMRRNIEDKYLFGEGQTSYGYLTNKNFLRRPLFKGRSIDKKTRTSFLNPFTDASNQYGTIGLLLKDRILKNATATRDDSFRVYDEFNGLKTDPFPFNNIFKEKEFFPSFTSYVETQFEKYSRDDIAAIYVQTEKNLKEIRAVVKEMKLNIPVRLYNEKPIVPDFLKKVKNAKKNRLAAKQDEIETLANGGLVSNRYAIGGLVSGMMAKSEPIPRQFANGGLAMGTDTVPAMLTPGEFVIKKSAVDRIGSGTLNKINGYANGGLVGGSSAVAGDSVYNYSVNVNVATDSDPNQIARAVMSQIRKVDNHRVRGSSI
jgi:TP901 family phage tail tape measure protein